MPTEFRSGQFNTTLEKNVIDFLRSLRSTSKRNILVYFPKGSFRLSVDFSADKAIDFFSFLIIFWTIHLQRSSVTFNISLTFIPVLPTSFFNIGHLRYKTSNSQSVNLFKLNEAY